MAVSIAGGVITLLVPALTRQVTLGEESNRTTAVEAAVSRDLDWFTSYAKLWKLKVGSYAIIDKITNASSYTTGGASVYEPQPLASPFNGDLDGCGAGPDSSSGLAAALWQDAKGLSGRLSGIQKITYQAYLPPSGYDISKDTIPVASGVNITRVVTPLGNRLRISYALDSSNSWGLVFKREVSLFVEAAAWCTRLP